MGGKRTIITLSEEDKIWLSSYSKAFNISVAAVIRQGVRRLREAESIRLSNKDLRTSAWRSGDHSTNILELCLGLVQEVPENRTDYCQKISMIYELNGNENEARRFRSFAEQSRHENGVLPVISW